MYTDNSTNTIYTYRLDVIPFGASNFMLAAVLDLHLSKVTSKAMIDIKENIDGDNICNTEAEVLTYHKRTNESSQFQPPIAVV